MTTQYKITREDLAAYTPKSDRTSQRMAFADHVYAASEPIPTAWKAKWPRSAGNPADLNQAPSERVEDAMTAEDRKEQFGEECAYCGKDSWTCEHFKPEDQDSGKPYSSRDEGRNHDGSGESIADRNT